MRTAWVSSSGVSGGSDYRHTLYWSAMHTYLWGKVCRVVVVSPAFLVWSYSSVTVDIRLGMLKFVPKGKRGGGSCEPLVSHLHQSRSAWPCFMQVCVYKHSQYIFDLLILNSCSRIVTQAWVDMCFLCQTPHRLLKPTTDSKLCAGGATWYRESPTKA